MRLAFRLQAILRDGIVGRTTLRGAPMPTSATLPENSITCGLRVVAAQRSATARSFSSAGAHKNAADVAAVSVSAETAAETADGSDGGVAETVHRSAQPSSSSTGVAPAPQSHARAVPGSGGRSGFKSAIVLSPLEGLSEAERRLLKMLQCEFDTLVASGIRMPDRVTDEQWVRIVRELLTKSSRIKYYNYLSIRERHAQLRQQQKEERQRTAKETERNQLDAKQNFLVPGSPYYVMPHNTIFHRIFPRVFKRLDDTRVAYAMQFGQPLVVDVGFGRDMSPKEHSALHTELLFLIGLNRSMREPFHLCLCNMNYDDLSMRIFEKHVLAPPSSHCRSDDDEASADAADEGDASDALPAATAAGAPAQDSRKGWWADHFLMTTTEKCFTELYPREKLVYLTPHASEVMKSFDPDIVYILGGLVDLGPQGPLSLAKAKRLGIRTMKLPLDYFVKWKLGKKSLGINHAFGILKEVKENGGDWRRAIELHVPARKVTDAAADERGPAASESPGRERRSSRPVGEDKLRRKFPPADYDRLSFYRTSGGGKQYGHLGRGVPATYKHYKKPQTG